MLASENGDEDNDVDSPGECPSRLEDPGGVVEPDQRGDVGVDHGDKRDELYELAGEEGESSRRLPWRGMGSRMERKDLSSSSSSSELSCCGDEDSLLWGSWAAAMRMTGLPSNRPVAAMFGCEGNLGRRQKDFVSLDDEELAARDIMRGCSSLSWFDERF